MTSTELVLDKAHGLRNIAALGPVQPTADLGQGGGSETVD